MCQNYLRIEKKKCINVEGHNITITGKIENF